MKTPACWAVEWIVPEEPDVSDISTSLALAAAACGFDPAMQSLSIERVPDINWLEACYRQFPPFHVGRFLIHGTHVRPTPAAGDIPLVIDAATAFGSGTHGTTAGCLTLMQELKSAGEDPASILDLGCGSGILAIAAAKLWDGAITASDIDPECGDVTRRHCLGNNVETRIEIRVCDGFDGLDGTYDLIIANILAKPLMDMAQDLSARVRKDGIAILSGTLDTQADALLDCYARLGLHLEKRIDNGEWVALAVRRAA